MEESNYISDCSNNAIIKTEKYFLDKGFVVTSIEKLWGMDNYTYGDLKVNLFKDGEYKTVCIDYKRQTRDRDYVQIELIQVGARGNYSSWLYNDNISYCIYEFKDGSVYLFDHKELLRIAKRNNNDSLWSTCIVYCRAPERYVNERNFINEKLNSYNIPQDNNTVIADHINGAFRYDYTGAKIHSGFCLNLALTMVENCKIS